MENQDQKLKTPPSKSGLKDGLSFSDWIRVEDDLPKNGEEVLIRSMERQIRQATRDTGYSGGWKQRNCAGWECVSHCETFVTHFMRINIQQPD